MKVAYLILAHNQPAHLARLLAALHCPWARSYIHIDRRVDERPFHSAVPPSDSVGYLPRDQRQVVHWGGYSLVAATLHLVRAALNSGEHYDRYCLLSGTDFPICDLTRIREQFESDTEFMRVDRRLDHGDDLHARSVRYVHLQDWWPCNPRSWRDQRLPAPLEALLMRLPRTPYRKIVPYHGAQWWALTRGCMHHILNYLEQNPDYARFHRHTRVPDEIFFQSIVKASKYADKIAQDFERAADIKDYFASNVHGCHYIDWNTRGVALPKTLDLGDLDALMHSGALFARKFDERHSAALLARLEVAPADSARGA